MTIGPAPMMQMDLMSVRLGMASLLGSAFRRQEPFLRPSDGGGANGRFSERLLYGGRSRGSTPADGRFDSSARRLKFNRAGVATLDKSLGLGIDLGEARATGDHPRGGFIRAAPKWRSNILSYSPLSRNAARPALKRATIRSARGLLLATMRYVGRT